MLLIASLFTLGALISSVVTQRERHGKIVEIVNASKVSWKAALSSDINYDDPEFLKSRLGTLVELNNMLFKAEDDSRRAKKAPRKLQSTPSYPASLDLRLVYPGCASISMIRNQKYCGACWAFATMHSLSDRYCIAKSVGGVIQQRFFSVEDSLECCSTCNAGSGNGCAGGIPYYAIQHAVNTGVVTGEMISYNKFCKPYYQEIVRDRAGIAPACSQACSNNLYPIAYANDKFSPTSIVFGTGETEMIAALNNGGTIAAIYTVYEDFYSYSSGIYFHVSGNLVGGHAIRVIGYGEENGVKYWLCANSWGPTFGLQGFFKIRRGTNECGIESNYFTTGTF